MEEHGLLRKARLYEIKEDDVIQFKKIHRFPFTAQRTAFQTLTELLLKTPQGQIVHTGDFKFDFTPVGEPANLTKMAEIGKRRRALLIV
ncbi:hypothetical protein GCM10020331_044480 [Ectobacillus funiculus]